MLNCTNYLHDQMQWPYPARERPAAIRDHACLVVLQPLASGAEVLDVRAADARTFEMSCTDVELASDAGWQLIWMDDMNHRSNADRDFNNSLMRGHLYDVIVVAVVVLREAEDSLFGCEIRFGVRILHLHNFLELCNVDKLCLSPWC